MNTSDYEKLPSIQHIKNKDELINKYIEIKNEYKYGKQIINVSHVIIQRRDYTKLLEDYLSNKYIIVDKINRVGGLKNIKNSIIEINYAPYTYKQFFKRKFNNLKINVCNYYSNKKIKTDIYFKI